MYDVILLDENLETAYRCKTTDFLWHSKWLEVGEFQIELIIDTDLTFDNCKFVTVNEKTEVGMIQKWTFSSSDPGTVIINGYFLEHLLYESVIYPTYTASNKSIWQVGAAVCGTYMNDVGFTLLMPSQPSTGVIVTDSLSVTKEQTGDSVGTLLYELAAVYGYSPSVTKSGASLQIDILNYHDRAGDTDDEEVVFSAGLNTVKKYDVVKDDSNYRNVAIVAGQGEGSARIFEVVDISETGERKRHLWVDANDLQQDTDETIADYRARLVTRGLEKLAETVKITNVEIEVEDDAAQGASLGDIVWVVITPVNLAYKMKIIEIEDVYTQGKRSVALVFGDKIPSDWEKVKRLYK